MDFRLFLQSNQILLDLVLQYGQKAVNCGESEEIDIYFHDNTPSIYKRIVRMCIFPELADKNVLSFWLLQALLIRFRDEVKVPKPVYEQTTAQPKQQVSEVDPNEILRQIKASDLYRQHSFLFPNYSNSD